MLDDLNHSLSHFHSNLDLEGSGQVDWYPDRYLGENDNGGVHNNSGVVNLAFSLMVKGGRHPRNRTNHTVLAIDPEDFGKSLRTAALIFANANFFCLTPSSSFYAARQCTLMFAGEHVDTVSAAWDAVGVLAKSFTPLEDNVVVANQVGSTGSVIEYSLQGAQAGEVVTCRTAADNGDADLYVRVGDPADPTDPATFNDCASGTSGSNEQCSTKRIQNASTVYATIKAYNEFSNLTIECFRTPVETLPNSLLPVSGSNGSVKYYAMNLDPWDSLSDEGLVGCATSGTEGDVDLFVRFGNLPLLFPSATNDCISAKQGSSTESCMAQYAFKGVLSSRVFVGLLAKAEYSNVSLACVRYQPDAIISKGRTVLYKFESPVSAQRFVLGRIGKGERVTCSTRSTSPRSGGVALFVRFGQTPYPYVSTSPMDCSSSAPVGWSQKCVTGPPPSTTTAYVTLVPRYSAPPLQVPIYLTCTTCLGGVGTKCTKLADCCPGARGMLTCDGVPSSRRVCRSCLKVASKCVRHTQCCSGLCRNSKCAAS
jgi:Thermolysin metallopeptidase, alpha-helical domain